VDDDGDDDDDAANYTTAAPVAQLAARRTRVRDESMAHMRGEPSSKLGSIPRMNGHLFGTGTTDLRELMHWW